MVIGDNSPELPSSPMRQRIRRIWPRALIALGLAITAVWIFLLAFGFAKIIGITF
jgi:hypothetical protein